MLFDRSDPISDQQAQRVRQAMEKYKDAAVLGTRFDIYTFEGDANTALLPKLQLCALGKPGEANQLVENPVRRKRDYDSKFASVLDSAISELLQGSKQSTSPIIESLRAAAITSFGSVERGQMPLRLTMISDMVQHTGAYSNFQVEPNFSQLSKQSVWANLEPQLKGAEIEILYLLRRSAQRRGTQIQNRGHQVFWEQLVSSSGGRLTMIDPL
ncbi:hypothetical protein AB8A28_09215 [Tardiphaga sp. 71_E8_N1_1]|uniref:hypothetical protein n=1 Tax=Tardiphaga sp. 71_E8_N1_1 TaxID=3240784 RepID=UPI003F8970AB